MQLPISIPHDILISQIQQQIIQVNVLVHNTIENVKRYQGFEPKELNEAFDRLCQAHQVITHYSSTTFVGFCTYALTRCTDTRIAPLMGAFREQMKLTGPLPIHVQEFQQQFANKSVIPKVDPATAFAAGVQNVQLSLTVVSDQRKRQQEDAQLGRPYVTARNEFVIPISPHPAPSHEPEQATPLEPLVAQAPAAPVVVSSEPNVPPPQAPQSEHPSLYELFCCDDEHACHREEQQPQSQPQCAQQQQQQQQQPARRIVRSRYFACHEVQATFDDGKHVHRQRQRTHHPYLPVPQAAKQIMLGNQQHSQHHVAQQRLNLTSAAFCIKLAETQ